MSNVPNDAFFEREAARQRVIDAAVAWRTKTDLREWTASCQELMEKVDSLALLERGGRSLIGT